MPVKIIAQTEQTERAKKLTEFGFKQFSGGIITISATINDFPDSLNFILDTGSSGISLDSATVSGFKLTPEPSDIDIIGIAGSRSLSFINNTTLHLPGLSIPNLDFHIVDYEVLSETYGVKIDGIIGYSFFRKFIVNINYDSLKIAIYSPGQIKYPRGGHTLKPGFTKIPIVEGRIKEGRKIDTRYYFDIGAGLSLLLNKQFINDSSFLLKKRKPVTSQVEGLGGKTQMQLTIIKELKLGPYVFRKVPTYIFSDENNVLSYPTLAGLIGNDILRRFNTIVNYPAREIHIIPNNHFHEDFDYSYSGLNIYFVDGKVVVGEVMKDSPAEKSGFLPGDIIFGIGNNFSNDVQKYKEMIQNVGQTLPVVIIRNEKAMLILLKIKSIK
ncbi:MAG TPA: aspartyl protease family protein [Chitinophagaceae bacterium]|nr:aspartyl protease family protein [Chitinophagaceae bacterium]